MKIMMSEQIGNLSIEMNLSKEPNETLKMKRTIIEMNNSLNGLNTILKKAEDRLNNIKEKLTEFIQCEEQR